MLIFALLKKKNDLETPLYGVSNVIFFCIITPQYRNATIPSPSLTRVLPVPVSPGRPLKVTLDCYVCPFTWTCLFCPLLHYS